MRMDSKARSEKTHGHQRPNFMVGKMRGGRRPAKEREGKKNKQGLAHTCLRVGSKVLCKTAKNCRVSLLSIFLCSPGDDKVPG